MQTLDLSSFFQTKAQANDFSARLGNVIQQMYYTNFNIEHALMEQFGIVKKDQLLGLLRDNSIGIDSTKAIKEFFTTLQGNIEKLPIVPIVLAFEPKDQTMKMLSEWFMINLKKQALFDISVDRTLIAGAAITYNGKFKDFSIRTVVDSVISNVLTKQEPINAVRGPIQNTNDMHVGR